MKQIIDMAMNYNSNLKASLRDFPLVKMSGQQKFLAVALYQCKGNGKVDVAVKDIKDQWRKSLLNVKYNSSFYDRAQVAGWVNPVPKKKGAFHVTDDGIGHMSALSVREQDFTEGAIEKSGSLIIVNKKGTHSFDKLIRKLFAEAKSIVLIADSYVDGTIFDIVLDVIPKDVSVKLLSKHQSGNYEERARRFKQQYQKFSEKKVKELHDRFLIIDNAGYVIGPSLKDAASNYPALLVTVTGKEKQRLEQFFDELWKKG